jgi:hypothetical protein
MTETSHMPSIGVGDRLHGREGDRLSSLNVWTPSSRLHVGQSGELPKTKAVLQSNGEIDAGARLPLPLTGTEFKQNQVPGSYTAE